MCEKITLYTIENEFLSAKISSLGAELRALYDKKHDFDCLKREDDPFWDGCAPILFPICGRLWKQTTYVDGKRYRMGTHGFVAGAIFTVSEHTSDRIALTMRDTAPVRSTCYPFRFILTVEYVLEGASLITRVHVENRDERPLPFALGFHPGFALPVGDAGGYEDCYLDFPNATAPEIWMLSKQAYLLGKTAPYPLENRTRLILKNDMFDQIDSIFFVGAGNSVTFASYKQDRAIRLDYDGFRYLGLWKPTDPGARFLCIEPWIGSPDLDGRSTELSEKADMILLPAKQERTLEYRITVS